MLTELLRAWRKRDLLRRIFDEFIQMLDISRGMFEAVCEVLEGKRKLEEVKVTIYQHDQEINKLEQTIRTQLLEHLTLRPGVDISACLVLMSVVKDAERLGDYCKNLIDVVGKDGPEEVPLHAPRRLPRLDAPPPHVVRGRQIRRRPGIRLALPRLAETLI